MDKIGICACYDTVNYGSMLQAFATQYSIQKLGYDNEFIVYKKKKNVAFYIKSLPRLINKTLLNDKIRSLNKKCCLKLHPQIEQNDKVRHKAFDRFKKKYYNSFSEPYVGYNELCDAAYRYSTVIVGSDQLWLPSGLATNFYNLMFVPESINKVSYATSFGVSQIPWYQKKRTKKYLTRINHLSVREIQGANIIKEIAKRDAQVVVDPTMLLKGEEWEEEICDEDIVNDNYILCYFLGNNKKHRNIAIELKNTTGLKIVTLPFLDNFSKNDISFGDLQLFDIGPDDFVNLIKHASYILTDSFHGSVFSILFHKQFVVFDRFNGKSKNSRNSRIDSLCFNLGLTDRRYKENIYETVMQPIDYNEVDRKLESLRNDSKTYLFTSLNS